MRYEPDDIKKKDEWLWANKHGSEPTQWSHLQHQQPRSLFLSGFGTSLYQYIVICGATQHSVRANLV